MEISLTPELESQLKLKVESGLYSNVSDVIRESLRLLLERDTLNQKLRAEVNLGFEQLNRGEGIEVATEQEFLALARSGR